MAAVQCFRLLFCKSAFKKENHRGKIVQFSTKVVLRKALEKQLYKKGTYLV